MRKALVLALAALLLGACSSPVTPAPAVGKPSDVASPLPGASAASQSAGESPIVSASPASQFPAPQDSAAVQADSPTAAPLSAARPPAETWMEWQVVPALSERMQEVYHKGLAMGNNPAAFSKVGDCQNICEAFLCMYDQPGAYKLNVPFAKDYPQPAYHTTGSDFAYLQETIDAFAGSWGRESMAVQGGFNFPAIFSPLRANPEHCKPGETPLVCEIRLHKPSFLLIGMEYWYKGRTAENYENYLRKTVEYALEHGIVPIVEAKADNLEGDHSINLTTARIANEYDLPLWNFWRAVQAQPDHGMDTRRDHADGFHISYDAQLVRSFTALQTLDALRRAVSGQPLTAQPTPSALPSPAPTPSLAAALALKGDCPAGGSGAAMAVFSVLKSELDGLHSLGIYRLDVANPSPSAWQVISGAGLSPAAENYRLLGVAAQGCRLLVSKENTLYTAAADGSKTVLLSDAFYATSERGALWLPQRDEIAFITSTASGKNAIFLIKPDGTGLKELTTAKDNPLKLYPTLDENSLYWENGACDGTGKCVENGARVSSLTDIQHPALILNDVKNPASSPHIGEYAFTGKNKYGEPRLFIGNLADSALPRQLEVSATHSASQFRPPTVLLHYAWSADGQRLSVIGSERSTYSGKQLDYRYFVIGANNKGSFILPKKLGNALLNSAWSPDGKWLLLTGTQQEAHGYRLLLKTYNMETRRVAALEEFVQGIDAQDTFIFVGDIFWLP